MRRGGFQRPPAGGGTPFLQESHLPLLFQERWHTKCDGEVKPMQSVGETAGVCNREVYGIIYVYNRWGALNRSGGRRDPPLRFDHE